MVEYWYNSARKNFRTWTVSRIYADINNIGDGDATDVEWEIKLTSGLIIFGRKSVGKIDSILPGKDANISSKLILGLGRTEIIINANVKYGKSATKTLNAFLIGLIWINLD